MFKLPSWLGGKTPAPSLLPEDALLALGDGDQPCGPSLEYDTGYAILQSKLRPGVEVQYGSFIQQADGPDWADIERDTKALLKRSRDLQVLVWYTRSRVAQAGAAGLLEGLQWITGLLHAWPEHVHPQLTIDGEHDPAVRANTLSALVDPEALLADVRQVQIAGGSGTRLTVRDVERSLAKVRPADAPSPDAVRRQLHQLHVRKDETLMLLLAALDAVRALQSLCRAQLGDDAPDLSALVGLLQPLADATTAEAPGLFRARAPAHHAEPVDVPVPAPIHMPERRRQREAGTSLAVVTSAPHPLVDMPATMSLAEQRAQVLQALQGARQWIEANEPSSPVAVLLKQAERLWGKRFSEVAQAIPPELLARWDSD